MLAKSNVFFTEGLRSYLASDPIQNAAPLQIYEEFPEYPLPQTEEDGGKWIEARVKMLTFLTDQVREACQKIKVL